MDEIVPTYSGGIYMYVQCYTTKPRTVRQGMSTWYAAVQALPDIGTYFRGLIQAGMYDLVVWVGSGDASGICNLHQVEMSRHLTAGTFV